MSCGGTTCTSIQSVSLLHSRERSHGRSWTVGVFDPLRTMIDRSRRRQLMFELEKARQRGLLAELDERLLRDIGITREQALDEARKPFWR